MTSNICIVWQALLVSWNKVNKSFQLHIISKIDTRINNSNFYLILCRYSIIYITSNHCHIPFFFQLGLFYLYNFSFMTFSICFHRTVLFNTQNVITFLKCLSLTSCHFADCDTFFLHIVFALASYRVCFTVFFFNNFCCFGIVSHHDIIILFACILNIIIFLNHKVTFRCILFCCLCDKICNSTYSC